MKKPGNINAAPIKGKARGEAHSANAGRGRRKYQLRKGYEPTFSIIENMDVARMGELAQLPGAKLAIELQRLKLAQGSRELHAQEELTRQATEGNAKFFEDFAQGLRFCIERDPYGPADPIAVACLQYGLLTHGQGSLTHLQVFLAERFESFPDSREIGRLCKKLGIRFTPEKAGRKPIK